MLSAFDAPVHTVKNHRAAALNLQVGNFEDDFCLLHAEILTAKAHGTKFRMGEESFYLCLCVLMLNLAEKCFVNRSRPKPRG